ncbi:cobalamin (vitamin B12) biosynthesis CbiX protein [Desulfofundulus kuznetsovii DSM 6115]|uniref:Cobalamin (Vitamin B12) biosynthesis CbiX protein n=1 Tax=Desulfofundulus kuznetsovii (strain DSM 6115 / VKM B-1805 / 17) TaxID=760568 RepID=A0AAU8Q2B4_DESK7|nr:cobalamin (vitamin B12) biosynthesis CbiX protein [Desulfofundulus kuznetsovii DSM 6115]
MKTGIILLVHGSRLPEAQATLHLLKELVAQESSYDLVEGASLQFNQPDLPAALATMAARGMKRVVVVPLFLSQGVHMKEDIPEILAREKARYPHMDIVMTGNIGAHRKLAEIIMERIREVSDQHAINY